MAETLAYADGASVELVGGSQGRLNGSNRTSLRSFYASRDLGKGYAFPSLMSASAGNIVAYLRNASSTDHLYINKIKVSADVASSFKVFFGNNTSATGTDVIPAEMNATKSIAADVEAKANAVVGGVTATTFIGNISVAGSGEEREIFAEGIILGQNDNIVVEYDAGAGGNIRVDILFHMEEF